ncbi:maleylpyruvate isomerase N-terminal domain-containing protein [Actinomadura rugatobispora]|uniref:Maleylpyruvate isomerase N-terminal domain-containing protein n=1 Tax=Actinomadura rugatobispora TaxID=1994 RepID=A0ABW0ZUP8_9ACTN|nr:hypothetical protein GCM10010200_111330 [Actinomadura rugatobispora]
MSVAGVAATRLLVEDTLRVIRGLGADDWACDSACPGWRVQDVIVHMAAFFHTVADPTSAPDEPTGLAERINDAAVRERAHWGWEQAAEYYAEKSSAGLVLLEGIQAPEYAEVTMPVAELGTYRLAELSNAFAFDHLVHLSSDLLAPFGPIAQDAVAMDADRIGPALDWMLAGLPQMCGTALAPVLTRPLGVDLRGPAARRFVLRPGAEPGTVQLDEDAPLPGDVARSSTVDFLRWATTRTDWRTAVTIDGDPSFVAPVLTAVNVI